jgi:hypothetical protein
MTISSLLGVLVALVPNVLTGEKQDPWHTRAYVLGINLLALGQTVISCISAMNTVGGTQHAWVSLALGCPAVRSHTLNRFNSAFLITSDVHRATRDDSAKLLYSEVLANARPTVALDYAFFSSLAFCERFWFLHRKWDTLGIISHI